MTLETSSRKALNWTHHWRDFTYTVLSHVMKHIWTHFADNDISEDLKEEIETEIDNNENPQKVAAKQQKIKEAQEQEMVELMNLTYVISQAQPNFLLNQLTNVIWLRTN